jgi:hypothetical protein
MIHEMIFFYKSHTLDRIIIIGVFQSRKNIKLKSSSKVQNCRNPTLAKCGGEAQHSQSWGFGVLWDSQMFKARQQGPKHLALRCSWCH